MRVCGLSTATTALGSVTLPGRADPAFNAEWFLLPFNVCHSVATGMLPPCAPLAGGGPFVVAAGRGGGGA